MSLKHLFSVAALTLACTAGQAAEVTHELGTTNVPDNPQRVIVLEYSFIDALAAVGVAPVGIADDNDRANVIPAYTDVIGDEWVSVGARKTPSFEVMASLQPDLIIADTSRHADVYEAMSEIAPTIVLDSITGDYFDGLEAVAVIGEALGKSEEMAARIAEHEAVMAELIAQMDGAEALSAQFGVANAESLFLHSPSSYVGSLLSSFGFKSNMAPSEGGTYEENYVQTSLEQLSEIDPQILITGNYTEPSAVQNWEGQPLFDQLTAVQNGHAFEVVPHNWSRLRGMLAAEMLARDVVGILDQVNQD